MAKFRSRRSKPRPEIPSDAPRYCGPHATGQAYSIWPKGSRLAGQHRYHGLFGTPESRENYRRWVLELKFDADQTAGVSERPSLTVAEVCERWLVWAAANHLYEKGGKPTGAFANYRAAMLYLMSSYGSLLAERFTPYCLALCRESMCSAGLSRNTVNGYIAKLKRVWRRAAAWGLLTNEAYVAIEKFEPLRKNEGGKERARQTSVSESDVQAVRQHLSPAVAAIVDVLTWSGCRTQEVRLMRTCDIRDEDESIPPALQGQCWVYRPHRHKTQHHGKARTIFLGPQARQIIEPWLRPAEPTRYLFLPYETIVHRNRRLFTKHGQYASTKKRRATYDADRPYAHNSIWWAIGEACKKAGIPHWHPHQLRHLAATRIAARYGVDVAQLLLGHANIATTLKYVDPGVLTRDERDRYAVALKAVAESG